MNEQNEQDERVNEELVERFLVGVERLSVAELRTVRTSLDRFARPGGERPVTGDGQTTSAATVREVQYRLAEELSRRGVDCFIANDIQQVYRTICGDSCSVAAKR